MRRHLWVLLLSLGLAAPADVAQTGFGLPDGPADAAPKPVQSCRGTDMFAELAKSDPELHKRVTGEAAKTANGNAILWKVEKPGVAPSHLFGTMHLSDPRIAKLSDKTREALHTSQIVMVEVAEANASASANALLQARHLAFFMDGRSLGDLLSETDFAKVQGAVSRAGVPPTFVGMLRPWVIGMLLASSDCERENVAAGAPILDMVIEQEARSKGIPVKGLESLQSQLQALASIPEDQQIATLRSTLHYVERTNDLLESVTQLYLTRNLGAVWPLQLALGEKAGVPASAFKGFESSIVVKRNLSMRSAALPHIEKGGAFIAVGALHLPGEFGLVEQLREIGYTITAVE
jgi:uncharacterized protein